MLEIKRNKTLKYGKTNSWIYGNKKWLMINIIAKIKFSATA